MINEFYNLYVSAVHIKTEYQNAEKVTTDCLSNEEVTAEHGRNYSPPCSHIIYTTHIRNGEKQILERRKRSIQGMNKKSFNKMN